VTKIRWTVLAFVLAAVLACVLSRKAPPPPEFPARSPSIPQAKVKPQIEVTYGAAILLAPNGTIWGWGSKLHQQIVPNDTAIPRQIGTNADWVQIACGFTSFALALKSDGSLWGWGANGVGQIGTLTKSGKTDLCQIGTSFDWALARAGASHALALKRDGSLWGWGQNDKGQVGDGTTSNKFAPTLISDDRDWKQIDCGHFNSFGLKSNGTLWAWGLSVPSQSGNDLLVPTQIDEGTNWSAISAGDYHLLARKNDGTLWVRGQNAGIVAETFATNSARGFIRVGTDVNWREIYSGANNFYARKKDGSWRVCGENQSGQLGVGHRQRVSTPFCFSSNLEPWAFDTGGGSTAILLGDGSLWTCGERMGAPKKTISLKALRDAANRVTTALGLGVIFDSWELTPCDEKPAKIWSLPKP
jgi:alpha-tubulin suppressor-like RCC1 family protein